MTLAALRAVMPSDASSREDLTDGRDRLTLLLELTNSFVSKLELPDVATAVMRAARRVMRSDSAVVALPDAHSRHLRACALDCPGGDDLPRDNDLIDGEGAVAAQVFRTGNPWTGRFADVRESGFERNPTLRELGFTVGCVLPLASRDRILGTLCVRRRKDAPYLDDEVGLLIQVAHQVTIAVANRASLVPSFFAALRKKFAISIFCPQ